MAWGPNYLLIICVFMVRIALISDTHGILEEAALAAMQDVDEIWHAGDIGNPGVLDMLPIHAKKRIVFGNIDDNELRSTFAEELLFEVEGIKVLMVHIGGAPPRYAKGIKMKIKSLKPGLFICGHSHICRVEYDEGLNCLYMNPGAIGNHGFHQVKTMLKFQIENGKLQDLKVLEFGKRGKL